MGEKDEKWLKNFTSYLLTEALEEAEYRELITREEVNWLYSEIGVGAGLLGLLPRGPSGEPQGYRYTIRKMVRDTHEARSLDMQREFIVQVSANKVLPDEWKKRLLSTSKAIGVCYQDTESLGMMPLTEDLEESLDTVETVLKGNDRIYAFQELETDEPHPDDVQPLVIAEVNVDTKDGKIKAPSIVAFYDGPFPRYHHSESSHPNFFFAHNEYIKEKVVALLNANDGDTKKLVDALRHKSFQDDIKNVCFPRGVVTLFIDGFDPVAIQYKNEAYDREFEWGWVSCDPFVLDAESKKDTTVHNKADAPDMTSKLQAALHKKTKTGDPPQELAQITKPAATDTKVPVGAGKGQYSGPLTDKSPIRMPPKKLKASIDKQKKWARFHFGKDVPLPPLMSNFVMPYARLLPNSPIRLKNEASDATALAAAIARAKDLGDDIDDDEEAHVTGPRIPQQEGAVLTQSLKMISKETKQKLIEEVFPKITLVDPAALVKEDAPGLTSQTGQDVQDIYLADTMSLLEMAKLGQGEAIVALCEEWRRNCLKMDPTLTELLQEHYDEVLKKVHGDSEEKPVEDKLAEAKRKLAERKAAKAKAA